MASYKKNLIVCLLIIFLSSVLVDFSFAQRELEVPIPGLETTKIPALPKYIEAIFRFALMISGIVVFGALIYGGFLYLTSAGNPARLADAKDQIFSAFISLIILLSSYVILTTINPELVILRESVKEPIGPIPGVPGGTWTGCSSYVISDDCLNANCKWCPVCSGILINSWKTDTCVDPAIDCGYSCVVGECGAETCE